MTNFTFSQKLGTKMSRDSLKEAPKNPSRKLRGLYMKVKIIYTLLPSSYSYISASRENLYVQIERRSITSRKN